MKPLKIIYNVLREISKNASTPSGIDSEVVDALIQLGLVERPWDYNLTEDGYTLLKYLENKFNNY